MGDATPARYTDRPLPDYRHVPGRTPHPTKNPEGHSFGRTEPAVRNLNEAPWHRCPEYLYGLDLFNAGYWWECHEALENLWLAAGLGSPAGHALQAIIQCAAAHLKLVCSQSTGAKRLVAHARAHVEWAEGPRLGLDLGAMLEATEDHVLAGGPPALLCATMPGTAEGDTDA